MVDHGVYSFENGVTVTLNGLPPAPVAWLYNTVDLLCMPLGCTAWRSHLHVSEDSWLADQYRVPWITSHTPSLLTYADFRQQEIVPGESWLTWNSVYRFAFETPSTSLGDLSTPTAFAVLCILAFALGKIKSVLVPYFSCWGLKAAIHTHGDKWAKANETRIVKFGEYIFRLLYHSIISIYGIWYFRDKQWWKPGEAISVFQGYPHHEIMPGMAWYYLLQSAYNLDAFLSLMYLSFACKFQSIRRARSSKRRSSQWQSPFAISWRPDVRGDFQEMFVHHVTTNLLVFGSSVLRFTRIGSMVFLVHDVSGMCSNRDKSKLCVPCITHDVFICLPCLACCFYRRARRP